MKLTQKQLASLAKVSTPTISRFEQDDKNLQLSSVLSILDVLGMTDRRVLVFAEDGTTRDESGAIVFWGRDGEARVRCRIARETLDDHFSEDDKLKPDAAFKKYRKEVESLARRKYLSGRREPDGSVLIRTGDIA